MNQCKSDIWYSCLNECHKNIPRLRRTIDGTEISSVKIRILVRRDDYSNRDVSETMIDYIRETLEEVIV